MIQDTSRGLELITSRHRSSQAVPREYRLQNPDKIPTQLPAAGQWSFGRGPFVQPPKGGIRAAPSRGALLLVRRILPGRGKACRALVQLLSSNRRCYMREVCSHAYVCVHIPTCLHAYMRTCLHAYMPTCLHAYVPTCLHAYMPRCLHTHMCACVHAYMRTCVHAYRHRCEHTWLNVMTCYQHGCYCYC